MRKLSDVIRTALTQKVTTQRGIRRELKIEEVPPSEKLVLFVQFAMVTVGALAALELVHLVVLGGWNTEIFAAISGLVGTITGILLGTKT